MTPLTLRQEEVLDHIVRFTALHRFPPSTRDIQLYFGWRSQNAAVGHLKALRKLGRITWEEGKMRTIRVLSVN